jgi:hypothetical protein
MEQECDRFLVKNGSEGADALNISYPDRNKAFPGSMRPRVQVGE